MKFLPPLLATTLLMGCTATIGDTPPNGYECPHNVYRHGDSTGVITQPVVSFVGWGGYWYNNSELSSYHSDWVSLIGKGDLFGKLSEYGVDNPIFNADTYIDSPTFTLIPQGDGGTGDGGTVPPLSVLDDTEFVTIINSEIQTSILPLPQQQGSTLYAVFLPPGYTSQFMATNKYIGYHGMGYYGGVSYTFAILEYSAYPGDNPLISHELFEAFTDSDVLTGYYDKGGEEEVGDLCLGIYTDVDGFTVQKVWSQNGCKCL